MPELSRRICWLNTFRESGPKRALQHILFAVWSYMDERGVCFPSQRELADFTGYSTRTIGEHLRSEEAAAWLDRLPFNAAVNAGWISTDKVARRSKFQITIYKARIPVKHKASNNKQLRRRTRIRQKLFSISPRQPGPTASIQLASKIAIELLDLGNLASTNCNQFSETDFREKSSMKKIESGHMEIGDMANGSKDPTNQSINQAINQVEPQGHTPSTNTILLNGRSEKDAVLTEEDFDALSFWGRLARKVDDLLPNRPRSYLSIGKGLCRALANAHGNKSIAEREIRRRLGPNWEKRTGSEVRNLLFGDGPGGGKFSASTYQRAEGAVHLTYSSPKHRFRR